MGIKFWSEALNQIMVYKPKYKWIVSKRETLNRRVNCQSTWITKSHTHNAWCLCAALYWNCQYNVNCKHMFYSISRLSVSTHMDICPLGEPMSRGRHSLACLVPVPLLFERIFLSLSLYLSLIARSSSPPPLTYIRTASSHDPLKQSAM